MTKTELNNLRSILLMREAEPFFGKLESIAIEKTPDPLDQVQLSTERELATRNLERDSAVLRQVRAALRRMSRGTYGVCLSCDDEIGLRRLRALPWTPFCISCQEQADRNRGNGGHAEEFELADVA